MKGLVVTTENQMYVKEFGEPLYKTVGKVVGGYIELVHPRGLSEPLCMIVNDEGTIQQLPPNLLGCMLYGTVQHGWPICGDIVIMEDGYRNGERDIVGLGEGVDISLIAQIEHITRGLVKLIEPIKETSK